MRVLNRGLVLACTATFTFTSSIIILAASIPAMAHPTPPHSDIITVQTPPNTDLWRKPPSTNSFSAPAHVIATVPLSRFNRTRATLQYTPRLRYDQGGLLLHLIQPGTGATDKDRWVKTGVEFYQDVPWVSTVATDVWSDWSVVSLSEGSAKGEGEGEGEGEKKKKGGKKFTATIEAVRFDGSLWVYQILLDDDGKEVERRPLREVTWFFLDESYDVAISVYAARPAQPGDDGVIPGELLDVKFWGIEIEELP